MGHLLTKVSPRIKKHPPRFLMTRGCFKGAFGAFLLNKISNPVEIALADQWKSESK